MATLNGYIGRVSPALIAFLKVRPRYAGENSNANESRQPRPDCVMDGGLPRLKMFEIIYLVVEMAFPLVLIDCAAPKLSADCAEYNNVLNNLRPTLSEDFQAPTLSVE